MPANGRWDLIRRLKVKPEKAVQSIPDAVRKRQRCAASLVKNFQNSANVLK